MQREIQITQDGSHTISIPELHITYHSIYGAVQESMHVFIQAGLMPLLNTKPVLHVFEMGFGTGLNALLSLQHAVKHQQKIVYQTVEPNPLMEEEYTVLNYTSILQQPGLHKYFLQIHDADWEQTVNIHPLFSLHKSKISIEDFNTDTKFDVVYYDAFDPAISPDLWLQIIFEKLFAMMNRQGLLVTYSSKGAVRRALLAAGFSVAKLPGPPGKREITKAIKTD